LNTKDNITHYTIPFYSNEGGMDERNERYKYSEKGIAFIDIPY